MAVRSTKPKHRVYYQGSDDHWYLEAVFVEFIDAQSWIHFNNGLIPVAGKHTPYKILFENKLVFKTGEK